MSSLNWLFVALVIIAFTELCIYVPSVIAKKTFSRSSRLLDSGKRPRSRIEQGSRSKRKHGSSKRHENSSHRENDKSNDNRNRRVILNAIIPVKKEHLSDKAFRGFWQLSSNMKAATAVALSSVEKANRNIKSYLSSDFEVLLLRLTTPDDDRPNEHNVKRYIATTETFVRNMDLVSQSNTYRVTLRKLWAKMSEPDPRTSLKAVYLLHLLIKVSAPEDAVIYKNLIVKMSKEASEKSKSSYFDIKRARQRHAKRSNLLSTATATTGSLEALHWCEGFLDRYAAYVMRRARAFTAGFEEMRLIDHGMRTEDICAQMVKAYKLLESGLACKAQREEECEIVALCLDLLARDLRTLFQLFAERLRWLLQEHEVGDVFQGWAEEEVQRTLRHFCAFYQDRYGDVEEFLLEAADLLELYRISLPAALECPRELMDEFQEALALTARRLPTADTAASSCDTPAVAEESYEDEDEDEDGDDD